MKHSYQMTNELLKEYVRTVLVLEGPSQSGPSNLPVFTNGMPTLLCQTKKDESGYETIVQLTLFGKSAPADCWTADSHTTIIAYFFKPFALASVFSIAAKELTAAPVGLSQWSPHKFNAIRTQLLYADSTLSKIEVLDHLLIQNLKQNQRECEIIKYATDEIMSNSGKEILSSIRNTLNLNERTFQRIFKKYVGVTSSQYRRICQFQLSFDHLRANQFNKISDLAFDTGFADQSHFIRSFREFTKTTPKGYLRKGLKGNKR